MSDRQLERVHTWVSRLFLGLVAVAALAGVAMLRVPVLMWLTVAAMAAWAVNFGVGTLVVWEKEHRELM